MNGPVSMYRCRQIIHHDQPIQLPDCVFKTKNILAVNTSAVGEKISNNLDISQQKEMTSEIKELQVHQEKILAQLDELKKQMLNIKSILNTSNNDQLNKVTNVNKSLNENSHLQKAGKLYDFVINVNPSNPPHSLLLLKKLWTNVINIKIESYVHSSIRTLPETTSQFIRLLNDSDSNSNAPCYLLIRLIWKDSNENLVFITPSGIPVYGEVNFLRYLSRIGPNEYNYELDTNPTDVDTLLDIGYLLGKARTKTERHTLLQSLNSKLGKDQWLCNNKITIADVAVNSIIKQVTSNNEVNVNLSKWMNRCETI